jgi:TPR repeat protein
MEEKIFRCYESGIGTAKNVEESNNWLMMAAERGNKDALGLAVCLIGDDMIKVSPATAERIFKTAEECGVRNVADWQQRYDSRHQKNKTASISKETSSSSSAVQHTSDNVQPTSSDHYVPNADIIRNLQMDLSLCSSAQSRADVLQLYRDRYPDVDFSNIRVNTAGSYAFDNDTYMEILNDIM